MTKYYKTFFILNREDRGFGDGKEPLGYVKIEAREGKGIINCHVSNLKSQNLKYKLYIMKVDEQNVVPFCLGEINLRGREGELQKKIEPSNVGGTGISIEHFNVAAILVDFVARDSITCPLAAYKNRKIEWKSKLRNFLKTENLAKERDTISAKIELNSKEGLVLNGEKETELNDKEKIKINNKEKAEITKPIKFEKEKNDKDIEAQKEPKDKKNLEFEDKINKGKDMREKLQKIKVDNQKVGNKVEYIRKQNIDPNKIFRKLTENFNKIFKEIKPFRVERKDYRWWQIFSPVHLNNIFYESNIRAPILFDPLVMMAHFKYKHMIVGLYQDQKRNLRYLVCGIPSIYWVDEKPFGEMCRWAQVEGDKPIYGAFGYWLIYIDPITGKILNND